ncbi:hypothetical protein A1O3_06084 [Capronia epimyces CBS 606.96]|uniref:Uncharacterized protein n=1 Tax=Capronia epimyces CBS 606.96 TaxID=1182542 RepID=W9XZ66_9EURO|nr:uncharacterized protein A1O3_06084 [Capronia epimyces CBS 606.96]EXJ82271.1 hypothetical protein A1O3_06084 [Capronia epimyces CBS 606.96]
MFGFYMARIVTSRMRPEPSSSWKSDISALVTWGSLHSSSDQELLSILDVAPPHLHSRNRKIGGVWELEASTYLRKPAAKKRYFNSRATMSDLIALGVYAGPAVPLKAGRIDATQAGP